MKMTNLDYVQNILSSLGSDEVNSVSDTTESLQVLTILKTTYFNMVGRLHLPEHGQLIQLDSSLDATMPVLMYIPSEVTHLQWLKYFNNVPVNSGIGTPFQHDLNVDVTASGGSTVSPPGYNYITILPIQEFIDMTNSFNPSNSNVRSFTFTDSNNSFPGTYSFYYKNNKQPQFCTIIGNYYVIFDGYDASTDSTLQSSKTMGYGEITPTWSDTDSFIPNLDDGQVPLLLNEAKSLAYFELKQSVHTKAEQEAKRQWGSVQKDKSIINRPSHFDQLPNFGRRGTLNSSFFKSKGWDR
jgi:hypothetical protein